MGAWRDTTSFRSFEGLAEQFRQLVLQHAAQAHVVRVADVGGGANPLLTLEEIQQLDLEYTAAPTRCR